MPKLHDPNKLYSKEAEAAVIGSMLIDPPCIPKVLPRLPRAEALFDSRNRVIYDALIALYVQDIPIDAVALRTQLKEQNQLGDAGGVEYIKAVLDSVPSSANAVYYAGIIRSKEKERELIQAIEQMQELPNEPGTVDEKIEQLQSLALGIEPVKQGDDYIELKREAATVASEMLDGSRREGIVPTGFVSLDRLIGGFRAGEFIILGARPSMGKSALMLDIAINAARAELPALIFTLEMTPKALIERAHCNLGSVDYRRVLADELTDRERQNLAEASRELQGLDVLISSGCNTPQQIAALTHRLIQTHGVAIVFVDYIQLMQIGKRSESRQQEITAISRMLKSIAVRNQIPVVGLSQLNRQVEQREDRRPRLSDLRESGALEQDADVVAFLYRDDYYKQNEPDFEPSGLAEVNIAKNRQGPVGKRLLAFIHDYTQFRNLPQGFLTGKDFQDEIPI